MRIRHHHHDHYHDLQQMRHLGTGLIVGVSAIYLLLLLVQLVKA